MSHQSRTIACLATLALITSHCWSFGQETRRAVIVGVAGQQEGVKTVTGQAGLAVCSDARRLRDALARVGYQAGDVRLLTSDGDAVADRPTMSNILAAIEQMVTAPESKAEDSVLFAYLGLGFNDASGSRLQTRSEQDDAAKGGSVGVADIAERIGKARAGAKFVVIDAKRLERAGNDTGEFDLVSGLSKLPLP